MCLALGGELRAVADFEPEPAVTQAWKVDLFPSIFHPISGLQLALSYQLKHYVKILIHISSMAKLLNHLLK